MRGSSLKRRKTQAGRKAWIAFAGKYARETQKGVPAIAFDKNGNIAPATTPQAPNQIEPTCWTTIPVQKKLTPNPRGKLTLPKAPTTNPMVINRIVIKIWVILTVRFSPYFTFQISSSLNSDLFSSNISILLPPKKNQIICLISSL